MVNFDEIKFLESEIVDDDPDAPVGTLIHIAPDGKIEEVAHETATSQPVVDEKPVEEVAVEDDSATQNEDEAVSEAVTTDVENESEEQSLEEELPSEPVEQASEEEVATEQIDEQENAIEEAPIAEEQLTEEEPVAVEEQTQPETDEVAPEVVEENEAQQAESEQIAEVTEETVEEPVQTDTATEIETVEQDIQENAQPAEKASDTVEAPQSEPTVETVEQAQEPIAKEVAPKARKPRKPAQKKETAPAVINDEEQKASLNLKSGKSVNEELFGTNFEIQQPAKAKVVSTKKKQEKAEDLWAVATVAKPKKETEPKAEESKKVEKSPAKTATKTAPKAQKQAETAPVEPKKSATKKSTKVENITKPTEEKKVAKVTEKTTKPTEEEKTVKAAKATKATKEATEKETPVKEEKAPKATAKATAAKDEETVLVEGEGKTHGKYVIKKTDKGNFVFKLYSSNYRVVAIGAQAYTTLGAAKIGVQSIIKNAENAPIENQTLKNYETLKFPKWEIYLDKKGEYRLRLYATNGSLIATTNDGYMDISGAKNGITAVARASKGCAIVRNDNLW